MVQYFCGLIREIDVLQAPLDLATHKLAACHQQVALHSGRKGDKNYLMIRTWRMWKTRLGFTLLGFGDEEMQIYLLLQQQMLRKGEKFEEFTDRF